MLNGESRIFYYTFMTYRKEQFKTYIGLEYQSTILPTVVQRNILENQDGIRLTHLPSKIA
jgi:glycine cleavage system pyridoxal-binding protein P